MMLLMTAKQIPAPTNTVAPVVSGTTVVGETLSCTTGTWTGSGLVYTYQWREGDGEAIVGATNNTYVLTVAEEGINVYCTVTATNAGGSVSANSNEVGPVTAANPVVASLDFDGSTDYLSMSNGDWGSYNRKKFSIIASIDVDTLTNNRPIVARFTAVSNMEFFLEVESGGAVTFYTQDSGGDRFIQSAAGSITTGGGWFAILVHYDSDNVTESERMKMWINGSAITSSSFSYPTSGATVKTLTMNTQIGYRNRFGGLYMDGLIYSAAFVSGALPAAGDVFDGTAGKLKNLSGITGLHSLLDGDTAVSDFVKATDWTNNGTVTTSATVP